MVHSVFVLSSDPDFRQLCDSMLPFTTVSQREDEDVVTTALRTKPDVILVDIFDLQDWSLVAVLRNATVTQCIPLVVITGWISPDRRYRRLSRELGCNAFIAKPCAPDVLVRTIERAAAGETGLEVLLSA